MNDFNTANVKSTEQWTLSICIWKKIEAPGEANYRTNILYFPRLNTNQPTDN